MRAAARRLGSYCCSAQQQQVHLHRPGQQLPAVASQQVHATNPGADLSSSCLYLLDLLPLVYRYLPREQAPSAVPAPEPDAAQQLGSTPAESVLGALLALLKRDNMSPTHMAVVVDVPGATFRHRMYPQYKAHRAEHPPGLTDAVSRILAVVDALGIPVLAVPGVEADDVIGTLAVKAQQDGFGSVIICSSDKDYYQLLNPAVSVLHGPYQELYTLQRFTDEQQLADPKLWVDVKALMGDASDNIPGLKGIGVKTAKELVHRLGPVEHITLQLATMSPEEQKQAVKLNKKQHAMLLSEEGKVAAAFMKELVTINTALKAPPCQKPWDVYRLRLPADVGKAALERAQKLGMDWVYFRLQEHFKKLKALP